MACGWRSVFSFFELNIRCPGVSVSSDGASSHRKKACARYFNSGERMQAGGGYVAGGYSSAKPRWFEVIIIWDVLLRRKHGSPKGGRQH